MPKSLSHSLQHYDCIVLGAGAAGLMCAATAGERRRSVLVIESSNKVGKKILMSGGGRCNFTNYTIEPSHYLSNNPHFCKSALSRYTQWDFISLVEKHEVAYHEKTLGQLFCDNKSKDILAMLLRECELAGVEIVTDEKIENLEYVPNSENRFTLSSNNNNYSCNSLVVATGGLSIPSLGASGFGYDVAKQFGLKVTAKYAALVPFTFKSAPLELMQQLAGVSLPVEVKCNKASFNEALLFTHKGLSGPAMLQISNYWWPNDPLEINFLPAIDIRGVIQNSKAQSQNVMVKTLLGQWLPKRFVMTWIGNLLNGETLLDKTAKQLTHKEINGLAEQLHAWNAIPAGTEGYKTAEVTRGGIDTSEVSSKTFEANKVPGLYFIGEVVDVTGWLGGYNFQWAWASGYCAGNFV